MRCMLIDGSGSGKVSIFDTDSAADESPHDNPLSHVSRLHFHSDLPMPAIVKIGGNVATTGSLTLGSQSASTDSAVANILFAHGQSGSPMVFGKVRVGGDDLFLNGSVPLVLNSGAALGVAGFGRWAILGADGTNVILYTYSAAGSGSPLSSLDIDWEVYVTNVRLGEDQPSGGDPATVDIQANYFSAGLGRFRSDRRYMRLASSSPRVLMNRGRTIDVSAPTELPGNNDPGFSVRFSVGGVEREAGVDPSSYDTDVTEVTF